MHTRILALLVLVLLTVAVPVRADDAALGRQGETVYPLTQSDVRMAAEEVHLVAGPDQTQVDVTFTFTNEGPATEVLMGFPVGLPAGYERGDTELKDFLAWVDGGPVAVKRQAGVQSPEPPGDWMGHNLTYPAWMTFTVSFAQGQTRTVRNTYTAVNQRYSNGETLAGYILHTGRVWKGKIGSAVVKVDLRGITLGQLTAVRPTAYRWEGDTMVWRYTDLEPDRDIYVWFNTRPEGGRTDKLLMDAVGLPPARRLAALEQARAAMPRVGETPDDLDYDLALARYEAGNQQAALATVRAGLKAQAGHSAVPYLAVKEGLAQPADLLAQMTNLSPPLRHWLMDQAGSAGTAPQAPVITLRGNMASVQVSDPDGDLDCWGAEVFGSQDASGRPLARWGGPPDGCLRETYSLDTQVDASRLGDPAVVWYRSWAQDGRGHRTESALTRVVLREEAAAPEAPGSAAPARRAVPPWAWGGAVMLLLAAGWLALRSRN